MSEVTIYRKDYQPCPFMLKTVDLDFELFDDHTMVTSRMVLKRVHNGVLQLNGDELELISIHLDDEKLSAKAYELVDGDLVIEHCPDEFTLTIMTRIRPQDNTILSGLYRSNELFCTQCESHGFRRMTFFLDRPDVLAIYTTRICADKERFPVLLSNGNLIDQGDASNNRHWVVWHDPFKKPCYLFALVAGNLVCIEDKFITCSKRSVDLRIYVESQNQEKCAHAMTSLKNAMAWDEKEYGREYDLDIFMIVAVNDFNFGAMENKGLNIFNSKYILARPQTATDEDYRAIEGVVGHEYFHNWTGNRVTCRDWFQLSLKEGLTVFRDQEFSRDMGSREVDRIGDVKLLKSAQFPEDAGSMAHPVRPESYQEISNFYTATIYNKGAEVIRMQETLLGHDGFRRGMDLYFERHDGQAVTIDDFVAAMEDANQKDLTLFKRWYSQAGTPVVVAKSHYQDGCLTLTISQSCRPTPECQKKLPFHIPIRIALFDSEGHEMPIENRVLELREETEIFKFNNLSEKPIISLLRDFSAPVVLKLEMSEEEGLSLLRFESNGYAKWDAASRLVHSTLSAWYHHTTKESFLISPKLTEALGHVLEDESLDYDLRAELLIPPGFEEVIQDLSDVDVDKIERCRDAYKVELGRALLPKLLATYAALWEIEDHAIHGKAYGRRKLRNVCLALLMKGFEDREDILKLTQEQFFKAGTMTDQLASFALLVNSPNALVREEATNLFYSQWKDDELVLDKWFALQAGCVLNGTLERVKALLEHPQFNIKNPNRVRSLVGAFALNNPRHFHAVDGSGYAFLTDILIEVDKINPLTASRLATPFTRLKRYNQVRRVLIRQQLERLASEDLSKDMRELVSKSLKD
jgi:aminopeptidase N